jgi:hypothetical protein
VLFRVRVPVDALAGPTGHSLLQRSDNGRRGGGPSPPADDPQAPGGPPTSLPPRPIVHGRVEQDPSSSSMVVVRGEPTDAPSLAPRPGAEEVDLQTDLGRREATDHQWGSRAHPADRKGEPQVGMPQDPGRAGETRSPSVGHEDPHAPAGKRPRPGSSPWRPHVGRVPAGPGLGDPGV